MLNPHLLSTAFGTLMILVFAGHSQAPLTGPDQGALFFSLANHHAATTSIGSRPAKPLNLSEIRHSIGYPSKARAAGIEGKVVLRILVNEQGEYVKHTVMESFHPLLRIPCELHAPLMTFSPAIQKGQTVSAWVVVPFAFHPPTVGA